MSFYENNYDKEYWKPSFYTWTQKTIDSINHQLRNQVSNAK